MNFSQKALVFVNVNVNVGNFRLENIVIWFFLGNFVTIDVVKVDCSISSLYLCSIWVTPSTISWSFASDIKSSRSKYCNFLIFCLVEWGWLYSLAVVLEGRVADLLQPIHCRFVVGIGWCKWNTHHQLLIIFYMLVHIKQIYTFMSSNSHDLICTELSSCEVGHTRHSYTMVSVSFWQFYIFAEFSHKLGNFVFSNMFVFIPNRVSSSECCWISLLSEKFEAFSQFPYVVFIGSDWAQIVQPPCFLVKNSGHKSNNYWIVSFLVIFLNIIFVLVNVGHSGFIIEGKVEGRSFHFINIHTAPSAEVLSYVKHHFSVQFIWAHVTIK